MDDLETWIKHKMKLSFDDDDDDDDDDEKNQQVGSMTDSNSRLLLLLGVPSTPRKVSSTRTRIRLSNLLQNHSASSFFIIPKTFRSVVWRDGVFQLKHFHRSRSPSPTSWIRKKTLLRYSDCLFNVVKKSHDDPSAISSEMDLIESDISRCGFLEADRPSLRRVLLATSVRCPEVGYAQGMSFLAHTLLKTMNGDEECTFHLLVGMLRSELHRFDLLFGESMSLLVRLCSALDALIKSKLPRLHARFRKYELDCPSYSAAWFVTAFSSSLPSVRRLWDTFLVVGWRSVLQLAVALLKLNHNKLLHKDMAEMMRVLKEAPSSVDEDTLFREAERVKVSETILKGLFQDIVSDDGGSRWRYFKSLSKILG